MPVIRTPLAPALRALTQLPLLTVWLFIQNVDRDANNSTATGLCLLWIRPEPFDMLVFSTFFACSLLV
eukprot:766654-Heterocapsa_arctica.AAC.1